MEELKWDEEKTLGAAREEKEEEAISLDALLNDYTEDDVAEEYIEQEESRELVDIVEGKLDEPADSEKEKISPRPTSGSESLLDSIDGDRAEYSDRFSVGAVATTKRNIARFKDGKFEIIGLAPITIIEANDQEVALMFADHLLKNGKLKGTEKRDALKLEMENPELVKKLFGVNSVGELNNMTEEELARCFRAELSEATKLMLENILKEVGLKEASEDVLDELSEIESPTERDIFKTIIKDLNK